MVADYPLVDVPELDEKPAKGGHVQLRLTLLSIYGG